jgi:hypothetical protein
MPLRVCLSTAGTLAYPQGGHLWIFINWALGFRACGCDVYWLDVVSPNIPTAELDAAIKRLQKALKPFGLDHSLLVDYLSDEGGRPSSMADADDFDLIFDLRYDLPDRLRRRARRSALLDIDPGQLQVALVGGAYPDPKHNLFFSIGSTGTPTARFPDAGKSWIHTPPCVYLPEWPVSPTPLNAAWTTVAHWWGQGQWMVDEVGKNFPDAKRDGFAPLMDIPSEMSVPFKLALDETGEAERALIEQHGFDIVNAHEVASTPLKYRTFIQRSIGEFSAAKPSYVRLRTAWISDRTICYLASGKPCIVEDTGPIACLGQFDRGLHRFVDRRGAISALHCVMADYQAETVAARAIAEECFDAHKVCHRILTLSL